MKRNGSRDDHMTPLSNSKTYRMADISYTWVKYQLENSAKNKNIVVKDMVKAIAGKFEYIPDGYKHTFLIRHPLRVFTAYKRKHNTGGKNLKGNLTDFPKDLIPPGYFFKEMYDLVHHIRDVLKLKIIIIDSEDLLGDPERIVKAYCKETGLEFNDKMLHWPVGSDMWKSWVLPETQSPSWGKNSYSSRLHPHS